MSSREFSQYSVGADAHIGPLGSYEFAADFRKNGAICRADVGIGPYSQTGKCNSNSQKRFCFRGCLLPTSQSASLTAPLCEGEPRRGASLVLASPFKGRWLGGAETERCRGRYGFASGFRFLQLRAATSQSASLTAPLKRGAKGEPRRHYRL